MTCPGSHCQFSSRTRILARAGLTSKPGLGPQYLLPLLSIQRKTGQPVSAPDSQALQKVSQAARGPLFHLGS